MTLKFALLLAAVTGFGIATGAEARNPLPTSSDTLKRYGDVDGWTVYKVVNRGDCLIVADFDGGRGAVQMGVTDDDGLVGYMGIFSKRNFGVVDGRESPIVISIDGRIYDGVSTGLSGHIKGSFSGGYIETTPLFVRDVAKRYKMTVFPDTAAAFEVDLKGTYKAMQMARKCFRS